MSTAVGKGTAAEVLSALAFEMPCPTCHVRGRRLCRNEKQEVMDFLHGDRVGPLARAFYMGTKHPAPRQAPQPQAPAKQGDSS